MRSGVECATSSVWERSLSQRVQKISSLIRLSGASIASAKGSGAAIAVILAVAMTQSAVARRAIPAQSLSVAPRTQKARRVVFHAAAQTESAISPSQETWGAAVVSARSSLSSPLMHVSNANTPAIS